MPAAEKIRDILLTRVSSKGNPFADCDEPKPADALVALGSMDRMPPFAFYIRYGQRYVCMRALPTKSFQRMPASLGAPPPRPMHRRFSHARLRAQLIAAYASPSNS